MSDSLRVIPIPAFEDNYIWLIYSVQSRQAIAIDPGETTRLLPFLKQEKLILTDLLITHHHGDHTNGIYELKAQLPDLKVHGTKRISEVTHRLTSGSTLTLSDYGLSFEILDLAGHTLDHIAFYSKAQNWLFSGDAIFSAGCGRVFEGSYQQAFEALCLIKQLPEQTQIFATHEYTEYNLGFAKKVEPDNSDIYDYIKTVKQKRQTNLPSLPTSVAVEKTINPFLRTDTLNIQDFCQTQTNNKKLSELDCFGILRDLRNDF